MPTPLIPVKPYQRKFLQPNITYNTWHKLADFADTLVQQKIHSIKDLADFLEKKNEFDIIVLQQNNWYELQTYRYLNDDTIKKERDDFFKDVWEQYFLTQGLLNQKIINSSYLQDLMAAQPEMQTMILNLTTQHKTHSEKNADLLNQLDTLIANYNQITATQKITIDGETVNIHRAYRMAKDKDIPTRKSISTNIQKRLQEDADVLSDLYSEMIQLRHQVANNANYENFQAYIWDKKSRIHYTPTDCQNFCTLIQKHLIPVYKNIIDKRKQSLQQSTLLDCDMHVELGTAQPHEYGKNSAVFLENLQQVFGEIHPEFATLFQYLKEEKRLDLEARSDKAFAMLTDYMPESKLPFVFYTPSKSLHDIHGSVHEITHAFHSLYMNHLELEEFKNVGAEASELFTLSMELISSEHWGVFFEDEQNLIRAKLKKVKTCLIWFRMIALWDQFQSWVYTNPMHSHTERNIFWDQLEKKYDVGISKVTKQKPENNVGWQNRPLIFRAPFHLISYGFAQLGACEIYRQYKLNPTQTIDNLIAAMKLGNTRSLQEIYETAGVRFDFSENYVANVANFLQEEYDALFGLLEV